VRCPQKVLESIRFIRTGRAALARELLEEVFAFDGPMYIHGVTKNEPGSPTVTMDRRTKKRIGLHIDNWDKCGPDTKHLSANRISINLGERAREFLFVPVRISSIVSMLHFKTLGKELYSHPTSLGRAFLRTFPDIPVIKAFIEPGCAYIAPTEALIHDASTAGMNKDDCHITIRGFVKPCWKGPLHVFVFRCLTDDNGNGINTVSS
jgi:hypothetical protein